MKYSLSPQAIGLLGQPVFAEHVASPPTADPYLEEQPGLIDAPTPTLPVVRLPPA
ncbi:hypothetical protein AB6N16_19880 [Pseudomonas marginalis]|uniref:hypothetical protein n=1 Tax=Pseudomonas fluorescens group TaxID=136843 RepID=UPI001F1936F3|nr:hypothetical protein [Pseudomonas marginalis]MCF5667533.1 hypothetical protein [Pseudomonas marginalis]